MKDILSASLISEGFEARVIGGNVIYLPETGSTNEVARTEAKNGSPEGTVVVAGRQTQGRGRLKRSWMTPEGNIALSIILRPDRDIIHLLIMMASVSVIRAIKTVTGLEAQIKWPNDVLIGGLKVCGILIETDIRPEKVNYAVVGIGINANISREEFAGVLTPATSLSLETGKEISRLSLIRELLKETDTLYQTLSTSDGVFREWRQNLVTLGTEVKVTAGDEVTEGIAEDVDPGGSLLVRDSAGVLHNIMAGDVTLRRE